MPATGSGVTESGGNRSGLPTFAMGDGSYSTLGERNSIAEHGRAAARNRQRSRANLDERLAPRHFVFLSCSISSPVMVPPPAASRRGYIDCGGMRPVGLFTTQW